MSNVSRVPRYFDTSDGGKVGMHASRWDERHRRLRTVLPVNADAMDYAPLIDMVRPDRNLHEHRYLGMTAEIWLVQVRAKWAAEYARALAWYVARVGHVRRKLDLRPRVPNNRYSVELVAPQVLAMLPDALARMGQRRATAEQWLATIAGLAAKGVRA